MSKNNYSRREWLNPTESEATGSVVAFDGFTRRRNSEDLQRTTFLEVSDCAGKVSLHRLSPDGTQAFIRKMRLLAEVVTEFADCLENSDHNTGSTK
jgi:hypothetical protein